MCRKDDYKKCINVSFYFVQVYKVEKMYHLDLTNATKYDIIISETRNTGQSPKRKGAIIMTTKIYFYKNSAYNAVVFDQENGFYLMTEGDEGTLEGIDLYAENAAEMLTEYFDHMIADNLMDLSGLCNGNNAFGGEFTADEFRESAELIAEYEDEDYSPYVDGLI